MLKPGTIEVLYSNNKTSPLFSYPIVQLLSLKKIEGKNDKTVRYHITISDGKFYMKGIFSSQVSRELIKDGNSFKIDTLIKITDFVILEKNGNCFIYVKGCEKVKDMERVGSPKSISDRMESMEMDSSKIKNTEKNESKRAHIEPERKSQASDSVNLSNDMASPSDKSYTPIAALNPFQTKWKIKGTIQKKSDVISFKKKDGKFFTFEIFDKTGNIKCVGFNESVDLFFNSVAENSVLEISKCTVKMSNKKFSNTSSDYEIHLEKNSVVAMVDEEGLEVKFDLKKINEINNSSKTVDVVGVVHESFPMNVVVAKASQREIKKRDLILVDETGSIRVTLWGEKSEIELEENPVLLFKDVKVGEFNNNSVLSTSFNCTMKTDPEIKEAFSLRGWYDENKGSIKIERPQRTEYAFLEEIQSFGTAIATVLFIREDNLFYNACIDNCNKKVSSTDDGFFCERCNQTKTTCNVRYLTTLHISDFTQQAWLNVFDDFCNVFFGMSAIELKRMGEENSSQLQNYLKTLLFKEFVIRIKRSEEVYNGEMRIRWRGLSIKKVDYIEETGRMLKLMGY